MEPVAERTFVIIKPDGMDHAGDVITSIQYERFDIVRLKLIQLSPAGIEKLYEAHVKKHFFAAMSRFMQERPVIVMVLRRQHAITYWRNILGATDSRAASPYTLRGRFGNKRGVIYRNVAHGSDSTDAATVEEALLVRGALGVSL